MSIIGIIGFGTMGSGIAQAAAKNGYTVYAFDIDKKFLKAGIEKLYKEIQSAVDKGKLTKQTGEEILSRIHPKNSVGDLDECAIIIEAIVEDIKIKGELFMQLDALTPLSTILASNTSSISITSIASHTKNPKRVVGLHFFNPAHIMRLVEVVKGFHTSVQTIQTTMEFSRSLGKTPVECKDTPGFIVNRVARPFYGEALRLLDEGVATVEELDRIVKLEGGFKMGPFELMDLIGIDINLAVTQSVYEQYFYEPRYRPHIIQKKMVESGQLGKKTGIGFYNYR